MVHSLKRETLIISKIHSSNVVKFHDILATQNYFYIVQELCDQDLRNYMKACNKIP